MKKYIIGNWKMNLDYVEAKSLIQDIAKEKDNFNLDAEIVVCPPMPYLSVFHELLKDNEWIKLGSQNMYNDNSGAFTGETSPTQLKSIGVNYVLIGHSERRKLFAEDNKILGLKVKAALASGIVPVFCCGENLQVRKSNVFKEFIMKQIEDVIFEMSAQEVERIIIAYEPIWAIGTGQTATAIQAQEIHELIRLRLGKQFGEKTAAAVPIIYGGSVKPENAAELFEQNDINGALIGGASLKADSFSQISSAKT
ncbi:MAG: triose-phosphate isomerase [Crocinitomicaceae bacterium]